MVQTTIKRSAVWENWDIFGTYSRAHVWGSNWSDPSTVTSVRMRCCAACQYSIPGSVIKIMNWKRERPAARNIRLKQSEQRRHSASVDRPVQKAIKPCATIGLQAYRSTAVLVQLRQFPRQMRITRNCIFIVY